MAAGLLLISVAYAAGRSGSSWAVTYRTGAYWAGQALLFGPLVWRVLYRPRPRDKEAAGLVLCAAIATYLIKFCYSPAAFRFSDELEHWRTTVNLLGSHHLFGVNYLLPVSPGYPGLEEVTAALVSLTGMSLFAAGLIVAGLAHVLFTAALYLLFRLVSHSPRIALAACAIYATNPHYQVFDAIYGYQTLALAFFGLALVAALGIAGKATGPDRARWWALAIALTAATVVTHHVTSYMLAVAFFLLAAVGASRKRGAVRAATLAAVTAGLVAAWAGLVATGTVSYLTPAVHSFTDGLAGAFSGHTAAGGEATPSGPLIDQVAGYAATILIMIGLPFGWWRIWRTRRSDTWALALGVAACAYYLLALLRVTAPDGSELAGRALTFVYVPVSYTLAMALTGLRRGKLPVVAAGAVILVAGGIASGWPPYWERLPGSYVVDGFESGITPEGVAAAAWAGETLGPGQRIAADYTNYLLLGSYGDQNPVGDLDPLYCGAIWNPVDAALASQQQIGYLFVDLRMSEQKSVTGGYFTEPAPACSSPIPRQQLTKFDTVPGFNRIYDSGNIVIYAVPGDGYAP
ncbi:MAG TPA: hypothetical protein VGG16_29025 [Streptosporangiaceae bacterium]